MNLELLRKVLRLTGPSSPEGEVQAALARANAIVQKGGGWDRVLDGTGPAQAPCPPDYATLKGEKLRLEALAQTLRDQIVEWQNKCRRSDDDRRRLQKKYDALLAQSKDAATLRDQVLHWQGAYDRAKDRIRELERQPPAEPAAFDLGETSAKRPDVSHAEMLVYCHAMASTATDRARVSVISDRLLKKPDLPKSLATELSTMYRRLKLENGQ